MSRRGAPYADIRVKKSAKLKEDWWEKYYIPKTTEDTAILKPQYFDLREPSHEWEFGITPEPVQCSHFNCSKTLTLRENLFGTTCIDHNPANYYPPI